VGHDTMLRRSFLSCPKSAAGSCDLEESGDGAYCLVLVAYAGGVVRDFDWSIGFHRRVATARTVTLMNRPKQPDLINPATAEASISSNLPSNFH
jgi:hypothetical protein